MKILKFFRDIKMIKESIALMFSQQNEFSLYLLRMQQQLDKIQLTLEPNEYEKFESEYDDDIKLTRETYLAMCDYLEEEDIEFMGLT